MTDKLGALHLLGRVARTGSFGAAARETGLSQPSVSRIVAGLERDVGVTLLSRSTRAVTLTEAGMQYLARIEPVLAALEEADHEARGTGELKGVLRLGATTSFAMRELVPRLPTFMDRHPSLRVDLVLADSRQDLINEAVDVALRFGALDDSSLTARKLGSSLRMLVASPAYLERAGTPQRPADLSSHALIMGPSGMRPDGWTFRARGKSVSVRLESKLNISVNEVAISAALAGLGIASTAAWGCRDEVRSGALVQILPGWEMGSVDVHAVLPAGRAAKPASRALLEYLSATMNP
ncbi:LysR family transcriptional regulator [Novosphingobium lentum]|uniref:LysR family transcriptional regulator n=1 Tax=Novosphingobium lentum TaxID=145287 RepID=UPI00082D4D25|nr:LysR family transcriptional regulator [Novosphingobium lentum]